MKKLVNRSPRHWHLPVLATLLVGSLVSGHARAGQAQFFDLGLAFPEAEDAVEVTAVSADGRFAVGGIDTGPGFSFFPVYWDLTTGFGERLPEPAGVVIGSTRASAIKDDNGFTSVIVGTGVNSLDAGKAVMVRWVDAIPEIPTGADLMHTEASALSGDGEVIGGRVKPDAAFLPGRWTQATGVQSMSPLVPDTSGAIVLAASFDGSVLAGWSPGPFGGTLPTWWDLSGTAHFPPLSGQVGGKINAVSNDGVRLGGEAFINAFGTLATLWDANTGEHRFLSRRVGTLVSAISPDGQVASLVSQPQSAEGAVMWSEAGGLRDLKQLLEQDYGLDLSLWSSFRVTDIGRSSIDGSITVVGSGRLTPNPAEPGLFQNRAYSAHFPPWTAVGVIPQFCDIDLEAPAVLGAPGLRAPDPDFPGNLIPETATVTKLIPFNGELYAIGKFSQAGGAAIGHNIARWNGSRWAPVGSGLIDTIAMPTDAVEFDDGTGPALYVTGDFVGSAAPGLVRWNGSQWSSVGTMGFSFNNGQAGFVRHLKVYDDGTGPALYVAGAFQQVDGVVTNSLAKWNGQSWSSFGSPDQNTSFVPVINSMEVFDDGNGPALYIGGDFASVAGVPAVHLARWDGLGWSALGGGVLGFVPTMVAYDDGIGAALYLGNTAPLDGTSVSGNLLRWDGQQFESYGDFSGEIEFMQVADDGQGPVLWLAARGLTGMYSAIDNTAVDAQPVANNMLRWDGHTLSRFGQPNEQVVGSNPTIRTMAAYDDGNGPRLYFAGNFITVLDNESNGAVTAENIGRIAQCTPPSPLIFRHDFED